MKRRRLLLTTVPAIFGAGCSGGYDGPTGITRDPTATPTETPTPRDTPSGYFRSVSLVNQYPPSDEHQVGLEAELTEDWITSEHTATVDITLTNRASKTRTFYGFEDVEVRRGLFADEGALLGPVTYAPKCIGTDGKEQGPFGEAGVRWVREFTPGESVTIPFGVVDDPRVKGCISPGTYRFDWRDFSYKPVPRSTDAETTPLSWSLKLEIEAPNE
jgi:hypothetical protein